jgi:hypothetical protein
MSYSNAVYYLDYENGSDSARAGFAGVASNPSGTTTLITAVGHGLVTGAVVVLSGFTAWLNGSWKITWVDADSFTLDDAVWAATADPNGTVTPNGGMNWADAWKTITSGATSARIAPGDTIRIAKSPAPSSIGNATWTDLSKTVTLAAAQTTTIDNCETAWTANGAGDATVTRDAVATDAKEGSYCMRIAMDASPQVNTMQAYYDIGTLDLSAYQKITFWLKNEAAIANADTWKICLCSDNAGATPVDTFYVPAIPSTGRWVPLTLTKDGGGNLGNAIESIAIYTGGTAPTASKYIRVDNFSACTTSGLNLQSLISKNSAEQGGDEPWLAIQSINGTTVLLDGDSQKKSNEGRGYAGTTETVTTYKRETIKTVLGTSSATSVQFVQEDGLIDAYGTYSGGWDTTSTTQDGETFFDGLNGYGYGLNLSNRSYIKVEHLNFSRYNTGLYASDASGKYYIYIDSIQSLNNNYSSLYLGVVAIIGTIKCCCNNTTGITLGGVSSTGGVLSEAVIGKVNSCAYGVQLGFGGSNLPACRISQIRNNLWALIPYYHSDRWVIKGADVTNNENTECYFSFEKGGRITLLNPTTDDKTATFVSSWGPQEIVFENYNSTGLTYSVLNGATWETLATDRVGGTGHMWKMSISSSYREGTYNPVIRRIARIAVNANKAVSISVYVKKEHATNVGAKLVVRGGQIAGVTSDVTATASTADTDWHQLSLADFTPTEAGVIEVEFWGYYVVGNSNVYIEDISAVQAS